MITELELSEFASHPVQYAIQRLRPQFLRGRGVDSINRVSGGVVVYMGATRMGGVESLAQIRTGDVRRVEYLNPSDATQRYGLDHTSGAIVLTLR